MRATRRISEIHAVFSRQTRQGPSTRPTAWWGESVSTDTAVPRPGDQLRGAAVRLRLGVRLAESLECLGSICSRATLARGTFPGWRGLRP
jgi:hypothetical protein